MYPLTLESLEKELAALHVPVQTEADLLERTKGWHSTFLGRGLYGDAYLLSHAHRSLVVKRMGRFSEESFVREARALARLRGVEGLQQLEAVVVEGDHYSIVSRSAGATLSECLRETRLSSAQVEDVLGLVRAALERMHKVGVAHMDLHENNVCVLVGEGRVRAQIIDLSFGHLEAEGDFEEHKRNDHDDLDVLVKETLLESLRPRMKMDPA